MEDFLTVGVDKNPFLTNLSIENIISVDDTEYIYIEEVQKKRGKTDYFVTIKSRTDILPEKTSEAISDWVLTEYKTELIRDVMESRFMRFDSDDTDKIIKIAEKSLSLYDEIYCKKILVKKLSNYLINHKDISLKGFLRFRVQEIRRLMEMVLSDAIEEFYLEEEYIEFVDLIKTYISSCKSLIDLVHILVTKNDEFLLYDFKKTKILVSFDNCIPTENFLTKEDLLLTKLIALAPKRIIWHNNSQNNYENITETIKDIFENAFSICSGCELCEI